MKHDAKLVSVYVTFFYASGPPVVKLDAILFGVSCRDNIFLKLPPTSFAGSTGTWHTDARLYQEC